MKIRHLSKAKEFISIIKTGRKIQGKNLSLYIKKTDDGKGFSAGAIVPKRILPLATWRNYIRRVIYASLREKDLGEETGISFIVKLESKRGCERRKDLGQLVRKELKGLLSDWGHA